MVLWMSFENPQSLSFSQIQATVYINYLTLVYVHMSFDHLTPCRAVKLNSVPSGEALTIGFHDKCMNQAS